MPLGDRIRQRREATAWLASYLRDHPNATTAEVKKAATNHFAGLGFNPEQLAFWVKLVMEILPLFIALIKK